MSGKIFLLKTGVSVELKVVRIASVWRRFLHLAVRGDIVGFTPKEKVSVPDFSWI